MADLSPEQVSQLFGGMSDASVQRLRVPNISNDQLAQLVGSYTTPPLHMNVNHPGVDGDHSKQGQTYGRRICESLVRYKVSKIEVWGFSNLPATAPAATRDWLATYGVTLTQDERKETNWDGVTYTTRFWVATWNGTTPLPK